MKKICAMAMGIMSFLILCTACSTRNNAKKNDPFELSQIQSFQDHTVQFSPFDLSRFTKNGIKPTFVVGSDNCFSAPGDTIADLNNGSVEILACKVVKNEFTLISGLPYSVAHVVVEESLKGDFKEGDALTIIQLGGYLTLQDEIDNFGGESRFKDIPEEKWKDTLIEIPYSSGKYPEPGDRYVYFLQLTDNVTPENGENSAKGAYFPFNSFQGRFIYSEKTNKYARLFEEGCEQPYYEFEGDKHSADEFSIEYLKAELEKLKD